MIPDVENVVWGDEGGEVRGGGFGIAGACGVLMEFRGARGVVDEGVFYGV
jgi:hypothetical protein